MGWREPQNPGLGGLDELTGAEETFVQNLAGISYTTGDILYYDGNNLTNLGIGTDGQVLTVNDSADAPQWEDAAGGGDFSGPASSTDNAIVRFDGTGGKTGQDSGVTIDDSDNVTGVNQLDVDSANGVDVNPGSDTDADLITVGVTGAPKIQWDESQDAFKFTKGIDVDDNVAITFGTGFDATFQWDGTDLILDYDSQGGGTTDFRIQENSTDHLTVLTGGNVGIGVTSPGQLLDVAASGAIGFAGTAILSDAAGTMTLSNVDALDATTESTIESAIDTLANLTSIQGFTVTLADAGADAFLGWDDTASAYENLTSAEATAILDAATTSAQGAVELATAAETTTGTDTARAVTPDGFAGSDFGIRLVQAQVVEGATDTAVGDGAGNYRFFVPEELNGYNLVVAHAAVVTAGTTGTTDIQIHNVTQAADMLSTKITIDTGEKTSYTAATPPAIDGTNDDVATGDEIRVDVDAVHSGTAAKGLSVILGFQLP